MNNFGPFEEFGGRKIYICHNIMLSYIIIKCNSEITEYRFIQYNINVSIILCDKIIS